MKFTNMLSTQSGLSWNTIRKYAKSDNLERGRDGKPIFMHHGTCPSFCDFACNDSHKHGWLIAEDVTTLENYISDDE